MNKDEQGWTRMTLAWKYINCNYSEKSSWRESIELEVYDGNFKWKVRWEYVKERDECQKKTEKRKRDFQMPINGKDEEFYGMEK